MPVTLRISSRIGSAELNALFAAAWPDHRPRDFRPLLRNALFYVCAHEDGRLVGFAKVIGDGGEHGFLLDPTVANDRRRRGIGRRLVQACVREARCQGVEWLHVDFEPRLGVFYRRCGFRFTRAGLRHLRKAKP